MPSPYRYAMKHRRIAPGAQPVPDTTGQRRFEEAAGRQSTIAWQRPEQRADRPRENQQGRGNGPHDLVLDHVKGEKVFAKPMQRRNQSPAERNPARERGQPLPCSILAADPRSSPESPPAESVKRPDHKQGTDNPGIECPCWLGAMRFGAVRKHSARRYQYKK